MGDSNPSWPATPLKWSTFFTVENLHRISTKKALKKSLYFTLSIDLNELHFTINNAARPLPHAFEVWARRLVWIFSLAATS